MFSRFVDGFKHSSSRSPADEAPGDGSIPPDLSVKQLKRGAAALKAFGIYVHVDYAAWNAAVAASKDVDKKREEMVRSSEEARSAGTEQESPQQSPFAAHPPEIPRESLSSHSVTRAVAASNLRSPSTSVERPRPSFDEVRFRNNHLDRKQPYRDRSLDIASVNSYTIRNDSIIDAPAYLQSTEGPSEELAQPSSSKRTIESISASTNGLEPPLRSPILPELPARLKLLQSHHLYHHRPQEQANLPEPLPSPTPRNGYALPFPQRPALTPSASSCSILKKPTAIGSTESEPASSSSSTSKVGKMVRITTTSNPPRVRARRRSSPKPDSSTSGPKSLQRSARHAQDYRSSHIHDQHRQKEEQRRKQLAAEQDLLRRELLAQRAEERLIQMEMEMEHRRALEVCRLTQELHLRRIEEQENILRGYEALRLAQQGRWEAARSKSRERSGETSCGRLSGDSRIPWKLQISPVRGDIASRPSLSDSQRANTIPDVIKSPRSAIAAGRHDLIDLRREDEEHGSTPPSRSPSRSRSRSRSSRLHKSSSRLFGALGLKHSHSDTPPRERTPSPVNGGSSPRRSEGDRGSRSRSRSRGRQRFSPRVVPKRVEETCTSTDGEAEVEGDVDRATENPTRIPPCGGSDKIYSTPTTAPRTSPSTPRLPLPTSPLLTSRRSEDSRQTSNHMSTEGVNLKMKESRGANGCRCEDGYRCSNRAICWATRKLRSRGPPSSARRRSPIVNDSDD